jgi:hypothetical protein
MLNIVYMDTEQTVVSETCAQEIISMFEIFEKQLD